MDRVSRSSGDAVITTDVQGRITSFNTIAESLTGWTHAEAFGHPLDDVFHMVNEDSRRAVESPVAGALRENTVAGLASHGLLIGKHGEERPIEDSAAPIRDTDGRASGCVLVFRDVTALRERERLVDDLRERAATLSEDNLRKNEFLATLAHELRNPLAPMVSVLQALKRSEEGAGTLHRSVDILDRQLKQLVRLVDDLLDVNRITHGRLELRQSEVELSSIMHQALEASKPLADAAGHKLHVSLRTEPRRLRADPARLAQVFGNLINNSCKYTQPGGTIWVTATRVGNDVEVSIKDTGIGIPPDKLNAIFEMFTQLDRSFARSQGGLGIGLTLVKTLVEMHGGSVEAHSAGIGHGSEFVVRLPMLESSEQSLAPPAGAHEAVLRGRILLVDNNDHAASAQEPRSR